MNKDKVQKDCQGFLRELEGLVAALRAERRRVGFLHKFFLPGPLGSVQEWIISSRMMRVARRRIYAGLDYYECGDRIAGLVAEACARIPAHETESGCARKLLLRATEAVDAWINLYPEIAYWRMRGAEVSAGLSVRERVMSSLRVCA